MYHFSHSLSAIRILGDFWGDDIKPLFISPDKLVFE